MRVIVTGHAGYIGAVLVPLLVERDHEVVGLDTFLFEDCDLTDVVAPAHEIRRDLRDVEPGDLDGADAVIHLGALSNDPLGDLNPGITYDINRHGSTNLASIAKDVGVGRFVFASSCSLYGAGDTDDLLDETAAFNPVTPYGESKILVEQDLSTMASDDFSPTYMRNATAYGVSPRQRLDIVVNNLSAWAVVTGKVRLQSDGMAWRPLVHVRDICGAMIAVLDAPREIIHDEAFNVGRSDENYRIREVAEIVGQAVPGSEVTFADGAGSDARDYRVGFDKLENRLGYRAEWTVPAGADELVAAFRAAGLDESHLDGPRYIRLQRLRELMAAGRIDDDIRWVDA